MRKSTATKNPQSILNITIHYSYECINRSARGWKPGTSSAGNQSSPRSSNNCTRYTPAIALLSLLAYTIPWVPDTEYDTSSTYHSIQGSHWPVSFTRNACHDWKRTTDASRSVQRGASTNRDKRTAGVLFSPYPAEKDLGASGGWRSLY